MAEVVDIYPPDICDDLRKSGIEPGLMRVRQLGPNELYATGAPAGSTGYVIPYFSAEGKPLPFYRVRLFDSEVRYRQLANQPNHVYFPPGFKQLVDKASLPYILLVEGEKKAAAAVALGIAAVAFGGVDSWRNRIISIPKGASVAQGPKNSMVAKLPAGTEVTERTDKLAEGMKDLIGLALQKDVPLVIIYDTDHMGRTKYDVQAAAAMLGYELRFRGVPAKHIRQLRLRPKGRFTDEKCGLDDFLTHPDNGLEEFKRQIKEILDAKQAFPRHPNPKEFVNKRLQRTRMPRSDMQALSTAILCDLDCRGQRLRSPNDGRLYYFQRASHQLIPVHFNMQRGFANSPFGVHIYRSYSLGGADHRLMEWLETQFAAEDPITDVNPERVVTTRGDRIYFQVSQGRTLKLSAQGIEFVDNGSDDILFESGLTEDLNEDQLKRALKDFQEKHPEGQPLPPYWYSTLRDARIPETEGDAARKVLALLYSISPWFYRWRGTQLPIEMMVAEPGSGKSTIYELRLDILTGQPKLRNAPRDMRDWTASVASSGGLHVTDNVNFSNSQLRQEMSDEICRIITEPNPSIEARKLYSDNELVQTPVKTVFAVTAVRQPFNNPDILQRSIITYLDKGDGEVHYEADWERRQLARFGGREGWIAYHAVLIHRLLKKIQEEWNPRYQASFRLINVEQLLKMTASLYGWETDWIAPYLESVRDKSVASADWVLEGLQAYIEECEVPCQQKPIHFFSAAEVADWAAQSADYQKNQILTSSRQLANYFRQHKNMVARIVGISEHPRKYANRTVYWHHSPNKDSEHKS